jgi:ribosomal protein L17
MQLRPRDGTGKAVTANDGKLRSFTKILDQDESDELTYGNVQGGQVYQMLKGGPSKEYIKFKEYKQDDDTNKKVPKIKNMFTIVTKLVKDCENSGKWDFKQVEAIRKYYVGNNLLKDSDFAKILKEQNLLHKIQPDDNITNHDDVKAFVDDAISSYRKMHPNRPIALDNVDYKKFVNKVLMRVRANYLKRAGDFTRLTTDNNSAKGVNKQPSVYSKFAANTAIELDTKPAFYGTSTRAAARDDITKLITETNKLDIIPDAKGSSNRKLAESDIVSSWKMMLHQI